MASAISSINGVRIALRNPSNGNIIVTREEVGKIIHNSCKSRMDGNINETSILRFVVFFDARRYEGGRAIQGRNL